MWSAVKSWFIAPFAPRVRQRVPVACQRVPSTHVSVDVPASTQAEAFLAWMQADPTRTGDHPPCYLIALYRHFCTQRNWSPVYWQRVAHELSVLIGEGSKVVWVDGKKQRMWHIPERTKKVVPISRQRVLGPMTTHVEAA